MKSVEEAIELQKDLREINSCVIYQNSGEEPIVITNQEVAKHNYTQGLAEYEGGTVVYFPEDIGMIWSRYMDQSILNILVDKIANYLCSKGLNICIAGNDILVDGYKVSGSTSTKKDGYIYEGIFVSFNGNKKVIEKITTKEIIKEPKGLSKFKIKAQEILDIFEEFKNEFNLKEI